MPLYEYECRDCEETMEILQSHGERPKRKCPSCGGRLQKVISAPAFQFKGTGWYVTDYADKKPGKTDSEGSSTKQEKKSESAKSDTKKKSKSKSSD
ncbi:MAG: FmdB family zinc ribbon protein [Acidobacteriota bacterium]